MDMCDGVGLASLPLEEILVRRKSLKRKFAGRTGLQPVRIAVLGGSTTSELVDLLELFLLDSGFAPVFHQSGFGRFWVEAVHETSDLEAFGPDVVLIHTCVVNIERFAPLRCSDEEFGTAIVHELGRFQEIWASLERKLGCVVIQNNFEFPQNAILGNLDVSVFGGRTLFVSELNREFAHAAGSRLLLHDLCGLSARVGLNRWFDLARWFSFKLIHTPEASLAMAQSLAGMVRALYGRSRKVLVLDLDDTLWGGTIGDDGPERLRIGRETPVAEAYTAFQEYCLELRDRGILLAVCSKNDEAVARLGFEHPDSVLRLEHFAAFRANWAPKHENILSLAAELNLSPDSFVFVDDNPAERSIVSAQIPGIAVPDMGCDPAAYPAILEAGRFFEPVSLSAEDLCRAEHYRGNSARTRVQSRFADYGEYLDSLEMVAEIDRFKPVYLERIAQLTNKTNQFNLTTRRYTTAEMQAVLSDRNALGLYGRLSDRFGDNGLVSIVLAVRNGDVLCIELWLMSCRVLKRDMEFAMLDALVDHGVRMGVRTLRGRYAPTGKNAMVAGHYTGLGFELAEESPDGSVLYALDLAGYKRRNRHIRVHELVLAGE